MSNAEVNGTWCGSQLPALKGGWEGHVRSSGIRLGRGELSCYTVLHPKPTTSWLELILHPFWCRDKPRATLDSFDSPRPGLVGSHHLPPYSIFCSSPQRLHPNGIFSRDSQGGVPKLSRVGLSGLWASITSCLDLWLGWGLKQSCSSLWELFNAMSHSSCRRRNRVDSWLLVVGSQIASLTPGPSFAHNLGWRCPNGSCKAILDIYTSRPFQRYRKHPDARCFDPCNQALNFRESWRTPSSHFWECEFHPPT
jgi:hypothetical protein